ncbi:hypothetical protein TNCV_2655301 [Trichonephila clavipes]|nr:hypothetical protein TNCV_2655301 [Trichonephila clavipes]
MDKYVQMLDENPGANSFHMAQKCICVFRTNRTREAKGRLLCPANDKGRVAWRSAAPMDTVNTFSGRFAVEALAFLREGRGMPSLHDNGASGPCIEASPFQSLATEKKES